MFISFILLSFILIPIQISLSLPLENLIITTTTQKTGLEHHLIQEKNQLNELREGEIRKSFTKAFEGGEGEDEEEDKGIESKKELNPMIGSDQIFESDLLPQIKLTEKCTGTGCGHHHHHHGPTNKEEFESLSNSNHKDDGHEEHDEQEAILTHEPIRSSATTTGTVKMDSEIKTSHPDHLHDQTPEPIRTQNSHIQTHPTIGSDQTFESDLLPQIKLTEKCTGTGCGHHHHHGPTNRKEFESLSNSNHKDDRHDDEQEAISINKPIRSSATTIETVKMDSEIKTSHPDHLHDQTLEPIRTQDSQIQTHPTIGSDQTFESDLLPQIKLTGKCTGTGCGHHHHGPTNKEEFESLSNSNHKHEEHDDEQEEISINKPIRSEFSTLPPKEKQHGHDRDHGHSHEEESKYLTLGKSIESKWKLILNRIRNFWKSMKDQILNTFRNGIQVRRKLAKKIGLRPSGPIYEEIKKIKK